MTKQTNDTPPRGHTLFVASPHQIWCVEAGTNAPLFKKLVRCEKGVHFAMQVTCSSALAIPALIN